MDMKLCYPKRTKKTKNKYFFQTFMNALFLLGFIACPIVNLIVGGKAWSVVTCFGIWFFYTFVVARSLVEYNRVSQSSKFLLDSLIMLLLIGWLLSPGWITFVLPIVCYGGSILVAILYFSDFKKQRHNLMPLLWMLFASLVFILVNIIRHDYSWPTLSLIGVSLVIFVVCIAVLRHDFLIEIKKRFHVKS